MGMHDAAPRSPRAHEAAPSPVRPPDAVLLAVDLTVAVAAPVLQGARLLGHGLTSATRPVAWAVRRPVGALAQRGRRVRAALQDDLVRELDGLLDTVIPDVVEQVLRRVDLATIAADVIATLDLPEIIRDATSAVPSETVREVRMRGIAADEMVARVAERLRVHRHRADAVPATLETPGR